MQAICTKFHVSEQEYEELEKKFGRLAHYAAWQLKKRNQKNNFADDQEDIVQELRIALIRAGSYYKRQTYIEDCFDALERHVDDPFLLAMLSQLRYLWKNKTRHGANRQKFGEFQEVLLDRLVCKYVPRDDRPSKKKPLVLDAKFHTYCKQIAWNEQKRMGKRITREKSWRTGLVSLSEFDYLGASSD